MFKLEIPAERGRVPTRSRLRLGAVEAAEAPDGEALVRSVTVKPKGAEAEGDEETLARRFPPF